MSQYEKNAKKIILKKKRIYYMLIKKETWFLPPFKIDVIHKNFQQRACKNLSTIFRI